MKNDEFCIKTVGEAGGCDEVDGLGEAGGSVGGDEPGKL